MRRALAGIILLGLSSSAPGLDPVAELQPGDIAQHGHGLDFGRAVAISGDWIAVGAPRDWMFAEESGAVYLFRRDGASWVFHEKLKGYPTLYAKFGTSLAMDGRRLVIGAPSEQRAYLFERISGQQTPNDPSSDYWDVSVVFNPLFPSDRGRFGQAVDLDGNLIVVAMTPDDQHFGSAYVFSFNGTEWLPEQRLRGSDTMPGDLFASSVAATDESVLVGAPWDDLDDEGNGTVYVFHRIDGTWEETGKLHSPEPGSPGRIGASLATHGLTLLTSSHVFRRHGQSWQYEASLSPPSPSGPCTTGGPGAVSAGQILLGSCLYQDTGGKWEIADGLTIPYGPHFAYSASIDGDYAVTGYFGTVFVHRVCDGCGTLREFARFQRCMAGSLASSGMDCDAFDFDGDGIVGLSDFAVLGALLVGP